MSTMRTFFSICLLLMTCPVVNAGLHDDGPPPQIAKVEPPNWWVGHSWNPVRVMIRGANLQGATLRADSDIEVGLVRANSRGTYLFADLHIAETALPGVRTLTVQTPAGEINTSFALLEPLASGQRFQGFDADDVVYLLMPDRFSNGDSTNDNPAISPGMMDRKRVRYYHGGDLQGVIDRLPYLKSLGITAIWLNPVYDNVNHLNEREVYDDGAITDYHGYGAVDFYAVDEHLGDLDLFRRMVDEAHAVGIKVIQDQVANHSGPYHPWVTDSPTPTWFNGTAERHLANNWQIWTLADPYAPDLLRKATLDGWFIDILPDLNQNDEEARRYIIQNTLWWIAITGIDGIRQDTLPYVPRDFWNEWREAIARQYPHFSVVGEMWDGSAALLSFFQGGQARFDGVDSKIEALFDFPLFYPLRAAFLQGESVRDIAKVISQDHLYVDPMKLMTFAGLHDVSRLMGEPGADWTGSKLAHTLILTARGIPVIYYGDEIGLEGGGDPDNRRDFPGGWPDDPRNAFTAAGRTAEQEDLHGYLSYVTRLRAELEPLRRGKMVHLQVDEQLYAFARLTERETVVVLFNNQAQAGYFDFPAAPARLHDDQQLVDRLGKGGPVSITDGRFRTQLPGRSAAIYSLRGQ